jgi:hypothetical protein
MKEASQETLESVARQCKQIAKKFKSDGAFCPVFMHYGHCREPQPAAVFVYADGGVAVDFYGESDGSMAAVDYNRRRLAIPIHPATLNEDICDWLLDEDNQKEIAKIVANAFLHWKEGEKVGVFLYEGNFDKDDCGYLDNIAYADPETLDEFFGGIWETSYNQEKNEVVVESRDVTIPLDPDTDLSDLLDDIVLKAQDLRVLITDPTPCALRKFAHEALTHWLDQNAEE